MLRISSKEQLLEAFRPIDRAEVDVQSDMKFPMLVRDYLSWTEASGHRAYLLFADASSGKPLGVVFNRSRGSSDGPAAMCDWCHSVRANGAVGLMTATVSEHRRVGLCLCRDLNCKDKLKETPSPNDLHESIDVDQKLTAIVTRMRDFARRNLF